MQFFANMALLQQKYAQLLNLAVPEFGCCVWNEYLRMLPGIFWSWIEELVDVLTVLLRVKWLFLRVSDSYLKGTQQQSDKLEISKIHEISENQRFL